MAAAVRWAQRDANGVLAAAALMYAAVYLVFLPQIYTTMDESAYMSMAYTLRQGTVYPDAAGIQAVSSFPVQGHMVSKYPLGMPLLLAAASLLGWQAVLVTNLAVHLASFFVLARLLRVLQVPSGFALLYLFHPTAVIYSRTVMADTLSGLLILLAFSAYLSRRDTLCGVVIGLSVLVRTANILVLPVFLAAFLFLKPEARADNLRSAGTRSVRLLLGALPFLLVAGYYMLVIAEGKMAGHTGTFSPSYFPQMFPAYVASLMVVYPGMLLAPALYRGPGRGVLACLAYGFVLLYSFWYYRDQGSSAAETLIVGQRYFLAVLPLFIAAYSVVLWKYMRSWSRRAQIALSLGSVVLLFLMTVAIHFRHGRYLADLAQVRNTLVQIVAPDDLLVCNTPIAKLFHPGWGARNWWVPGEQGTPEALAAVERRFSSAMSRPGTRVFLASWVRPGREGDQLESKTVKSIADRFAAQPLPEKERQNLPADVQVRYIIRSAWQSHYSARLKKE